MKNIYNWAMHVCIIAFVIFLIVAVPELGTNEWTGILVSVLACIGITFHSRTRLMMHTGIIVTNVMPYVNKLSNWFVSILTILLFFVLFISLDESERHQSIAVSFPYAVIILIVTDFWLMKYVQYCSDKQKTADTIAGSI